MKHALLALLATSLCLPVFAADPAPKPATPAATPAATPKPQVPPPTVADLAYGSHPKQVLDFYKAQSDKPTPLVFYLHGGGWPHGEQQPYSVANYLKAGISVVSIQYRFTTDAVAEGHWPPVEGPLH